jgi:hypothetical protein
VRDRSPSDAIIVPQPNRRASSPVSPPDDVPMIGL